MAPAKQYPHCGAADFDQVGGNLCAQRNLFKGKVLKK
jgi:hypothetical protein